LDRLEKEAVNFHSHSWSVSPGTYVKHPALADFFDILALTLDNDKQVILSIVEAKKYPIYATMFHPEKLAYEWAPKLDIPHDGPQIRVA
jgi:gamma-glutamyl hydrolase